MADWSQLPTELLELITKHLSTDTDLLRFRSICSTWRSSVTPTLPRFPILPNSGISDTSWCFYLSKRTIFRLTDPQSPNSNSWLVKLEKDIHQRLHLLHPLSASDLLIRPESFSNPLDLMGFRVYELGGEYNLQYINYRPFASSIGDSGTLYMEKVALSLEMYENLFVILTIHVSGKLALLKQGDKKWTIIDDLPAPYDDVIVFEGNFYAVDSTGRAVMVVMDKVNGGSSGDVLPSLRVVAGAVFGGDKKYLVESLGELYLVDKYLSVGPEDDLGYDENLEFYEEFDCYTSERTIKFEVYRLDRAGEKWVEIKSLGDRMLFLGDNCGFSASKEEFCGVKGNCIVFTGQSREEDGVAKRGGVGVFDLESGAIGAIGNYPGYSEMFWPPPAWVSSSSSNGLERNIEPGWNIRPKLVIGNRILKWCKDGLDHLRI